MPNQEVAEKYPNDISTTRNSKQNKLNNSTVLNVSGFNRNKQNQQADQTQLQNWMVLIN